VRAAARTFRTNPKLDVESVITQLGVGEALVSFLDENGTPGIVERALVRPPQSLVGPMPAETRQQMIRQSLVAGVYEKAVDRESAYEILKARAAAQAAAAPQPPSAPQSSSGQRPAPAQEPGGLFDFRLGRPTAGPRGGRQPDTLAEAFAKSAARAMGSQAGRQILRGVLGTLFGTSSRR
jgi:DNA double-strand break repair helicase HerA and related ATPase